MKELINSIGKKKLIMIFGGIVGVVVLIIVCLLLYNAFFVSNTYSSVESKIVNAAKEYYGKHQNLLPKSPNDEVSVNSTTLTSSGYLGDLQEMVPDEGVSCTATVTVTNVNNNYRYVANLKCGDKYQTETFVNHVKSVEQTVVTGQGLYDMNGELVYRGENPNNYIKFADRLWRLVKFENDSAMLILDDKYARSVWDDRFNADRNRNDGINDYSVSRANDALTNLYNGEDLFSASDKLLIVAHDLAIGKRGETIQYNDGSVEKSQVLEDRYIGLLPLYDYINVSLDENCSSASTQSCSNYNYLNLLESSWWLSTGDSDTTYRVYRIDSSGIIGLTRASTNSYLRPVIYLAKDAIYVSGDGTFDNPYQVK